MSDRLFHCSMLEKYLRLQIRETVLRINVRPGPIPNPFRVKVFPEAINIKWGVKKQSVQ